MKEPIDILFSFFDKNNTESTLTSCLHQLESLPNDQSLAKAFLLFSTLELLAQFRYGSLDQKGSVKRIKKFLVKYSNWSSEECEWLIQFRNAVVHTHGQWAFDLRTKRELRFTWGAGEKTVKKISGSHVHLDLKRFEQQIIKMMKLYQNDLSTSTHLQESFGKVHRKIGRVFQQKES